LNSERRSIVQVLFEPTPKLQTVIPCNFSSPSSNKFLAPIHCSLHATAETDLPEVGIGVVSLSATEGFFRFRFGNQERGAEREELFWEK
jgi:hypothetical protein